MNWDDIINKPIKQIEISVTGNTEKLFDWQKNLYEWHEVKQILPTGIISRFGKSFYQRNLRKDINE